MKSPEQLRADHEATPTYVQNGRQAPAGTDGEFRNDDGQRTDPLAWAGRKLRIPLVSVRKIGLIKSRWDLTVINRRGGERTFSVPTATLQSKAKMRSWIFEASGRQIPNDVTDDAWRKIVDAFEFASIELDRGGSEAELWTSRLTDYADERLVFRQVDLSNPDEVARVLDEDAPVFIDIAGRVWVKVNAWLQFLRVGRKLYVDREEILDALTAMGFESCDFTARSRTKPGTRRHRWYWGSPPSFALDDTTEPEPVSPRPRTSTTTAKTGGDGGDTVTDARTSATTGPRVTAAETNRGDHGDNLGHPRNTAAAPRGTRTASVEA